MEKCMFTFFHGLHPAWFLTYDSPGISILHVQFLQLLFSIDIWGKELIHVSAADIVTAVAEVTGSAALRQALVYDTDPLFFCCVFDKK